MHRLWAPWRLAYVTAASDPTEAPCVFCAAPDRANPSPLLLCRGNECFVVLNKFPYSNGHLMVVPFRHVASFADATEAELAELMLLTQRAELALGEAYEPQGLNVGMNLGRPAGAGVPGHLHLHVVPRWTGDTNFMTVTAETRVVPEDLADTADRLRSIFKKLT